MFVFTPEDNLQALNFPPDGRQVALQPPVHRRLHLFLGPLQVAHDPVHEAVLLLLLLLRALLGALAGLALVVLWEVVDGGKIALPSVRLLLIGSQ